MFATKRADGVPQWKVVFDHIQSRSPEVDQIFTHAELRSLGDGLGGAGYYSCVSRAARELEREHKRTLVPVRGEGYRFTGGLRHVERARVYRKRSRRAITVAVQKATSADYGLMDAEGRLWADRERNAVVALLSIVRQHDEKIVAMADELRDVRASTIDTRHRQAATEEAISRIEKQLGEMRRSRETAHAAD